MARMVIITPRISGLLARAGLSCRGHASENPDLPRALSETQRGIRFLGPPSGAMAALGDKVELPHLMSSSPGASVSGRFDDSGSGGRRAHVPLERNRSADLLRGMRRRHSEGDLRARLPPGRECRASLSGHRLPRHAQGLVGRRRKRDTDGEIGRRSGYASATGPNEDASLLNATGTTAC